MVEIIPYDSLIKLTVQLDQAWVVNDLQDKNKPSFEHQILMHIAIYRLRIPLSDLRELVADQPDLLSLLDEAIKPSEHDKASEELQRQDAELRKQQEMDAAEIRASWMMLHREISEYTDNVFSDEYYKNMVWDLFSGYYHYPE